MIEVDELRRLIRHEQQPLSDIEQIFAALVLYPGREEIRNSTRADRVGALLAACEALIGDETPAPAELADFVAGELKGAVERRSYGGLAEAISANPESFEARLQAA